MFIYFWEREWEKERVCVSEHEMGRDKEREGDTESKAGSTLQAASTEPDARLEFTWDHDLSQSQTLNQLNHPGAPVNILLITINFQLKFLYQKAHMFSMLVLNDKLFSGVFAPVYIPNNNVLEFPLLHILTQFCYFSF